MIPNSPTTAHDDEGRPAGFTLPVDIVVAPGRAFLKIARTNEWIPAMLVILVTGVASVALTAPAVPHIMAASKVTDPRTQVEIEAQLAIQWLAMPALIAMLIATTLTAMTRVKDPATPYVRYFSLAINCLVPSALGTLLHAAVAWVRQPGSFAGFREYAVALPDSLGVFAAKGNEHELDFLSRFNVFDAWTFVLLGFGISLFAGMRFGTALTLAALMYFAYALAFTP